MNTRVFRVLDQAGEVDHGGVHRGASPMNVLVPPRAKAAELFADHVHNAGCDRPECRGRAWHERELGTCYSALASRFETAVAVDAEREARADAATVAVVGMAAVVAIMLVAESYGLLTFEAHPLVGAGLGFVAVALPAGLIYRRPIRAWLVTLVRPGRRGLRRGWWRRA